MGDIRSVVGAPSPPTPRQPGSARRERGRERGGGPWRFFFRRAPSLLWGSQGTQGKGWGRAWPEATKARNGSRCACECVRGVCGFPCEVPSWRALSCQGAQANPARPLPSRLITSRGTSNGQLGRIRIRIPVRVGRLLASSTSTGLACKRASV